MARLLKILAVLALALALALPAHAADTWLKVCDLLGVPVGAVKKPQVVRLPANSPLVRNVWGFYVYNSDCVFVSEEDPEPEATLAHEYAHVVMYSDAYQERVADRVEKHFRK